MEKKYIPAAVIISLLIFSGAYFIYKIPSQQIASDSLSQNNTASDNIDLGGNGQTLGLEEEATPSSGGSENKKMQQELKTEDLTVGTGAEAVSGKTITVNYKGTLTNGTKFDSSYDRNEPFKFKLGAGEVIEGWDKGFAGMKVGGKRKLTIPPSMGYGSQDLGTIPPNSTLIFEVELLKVE